MAGRSKPCGLLYVLACWVFTLASTRAVVDQARDFTVVDEQVNIIAASNPGEDGVDTQFAGDANRFARATSDSGSFTYSEDQGIDQVSVTAFALISDEAGDWVLTVSVGSKELLVLSAEQVQEAFEAATVRTLCRTL